MTTTGIGLAADLRHKMAAELAEFRRSLTDEINNVARSIQAWTQSLDPFVADYVVAFSETTTESKRLDALRRLASSLGLFNARCAHGEEEILAALLLAEGQANYPQRVRLGHRWIVGPDGRASELVPEDYFDLRSPDVFKKYLAQRARDWLRQEQDELDEKEVATDPAVLDTGCLSDDDGQAKPGDVRVAIAVAAAVARQAGTPDHALLEFELFHLLSARCSERERQLVRLLRKGASLQEAAAELGIADSTSRVLLSRVRAKARRLRIV